MRSTTHNNGLNHFTLWCVYQEKIIKIDIRSEAASLLPEKIRRKSDLVCHKFHNIRIDTAFNTPRKTEKKTYWVGPLKLLVKYYFIILKQHYLLNVCLLVVMNFFWFRTENNPKRLSSINHTTKTIQFIAKFVIEVLMFHDYKLLYCKIRIKIFVYYDIKYFVWHQEYYRA